MKVHHIGYAVRDIENALEGFYQLGFVLESRNADESRRVCIAFLRNGETLVELVAPDDSDLPSPIDEVLKKVGPSPYHICYIVEDIDNQCKSLKKEGWSILIKRSPAPAIDNAPVAFLFRKSVGIIELVEQP